MMNHSNGWICGWMWLWAVIVVVAIALLVVATNKLTRHSSCVHDPYVK